MGVSLPITIHCHEQVKIMKLPRPSFVLFAVILPVSTTYATTVLVGMPIFRSHAITAVKPVFPAASFAAKHFGPAIAEVSVAETGVVTKVAVLEAPDAAIAAAVERALKQWTFRPFKSTDRDGREERFEATSRLLFYFRMADNQPIVVDALEGHLEAKFSKNQ
jgi:hypothetical protein